MNGCRIYRAGAFVVTILVLLTLVVGWPGGGSAHAAGGSLVEGRRSAGGVAYRTSGDVYWVLTLRGSWREMGRQYGGLVRDELRQFLTEISEDAASRGMGHDEQLHSARLLAQTSSSNLNELLKGIAESSGLSEDEVLLLNAGMSNLASAIFGVETPAACSGLAVWGRYTPDGALVFGRNWDIDRESMLRYMKYLSVVVFNPDSGHSFANVHPIGNVYLETGMNDKGLFIELNNGSWSDPRYVEGREDTVSVLVTALNECSDLEEAVRYLSGIPADLSHILQVANAQECVSVERATFAARVREGEQDGVLAAYNSFIPPYPDEWEGMLVDPPAIEDDPRYANLIALANSEAFYGRLDGRGMQELMDIEVQNGGAVHRGTVYQVIAQPSDLTLWIRGLGYSGWQQVDLKDLFAGE